jgi:hypothetical protein
MEREVERIDGAVEAEMPGMASEMEAKTARSAAWGLGGELLLPEREPASRMTASHRFSLFCLACAPFAIGSAGKSSERTSLFGGGSASLGREGVLFEAGFERCRCKRLLHIPWELLGTEL